MDDFFNNTQFDANANVQVQNEVPNSQNTVNVSLSQIAKLTRKEDGLVLYRQRVHAIICVGIVTSVEELTTKNIYLIDDYTQGGPVEIQLWKNENDGTGKFLLPPPIMERTYIRVIGQARYDENKPFVVAFRVEPITDPNEIYVHFLEVINDSMILEKRRNATLNAKPTDNSHNLSSNFEQNSSRLVQSGFSEIQRSVLNILNKYGRDTAYGLKRHEIKSYLPSVNNSLLDDAISFLVNEGHIFSTLDEDTFKSTDF